MFDAARTCLVSDEESAAGPDVDAVRLSHCLAQCMTLLCTLS